MSARVDRAVVRLLLAAALGFPAGSVAARELLNVAHAQSCPVESNVVFTNNPDSIQDTADGVDEDNRWDMKAGRDFGRSLACADGVSQDPGIDGQNDNDDIGGGSANDYIWGSANNDTIFGGASTFSIGGDHLFGNDGGDTITDAEPNDSEIVSGGAGNDTINVQDGDSGDNIFGDSGTDNCSFDSGDVVSTCP